MDADRLLAVWSDSRPLSLAIWAVIVILTLYLARRPAHSAIRVSARLVWRQARELGRRLRALADALKAHTRAVLLAQARELQSRHVQRSLERLSDAIRRDLGGFPHLQQQLADQIHRIDHDYRNAGEHPPRPPEWVEAVDAVAALRHRDETAVARILEDILGTLDRACHESVLEYRAASRRRHRLLARMQPYWRRMGNVMNRLERAIGHLQSRAGHLDRQIERYENIREGSSHVVRELFNAAAVRAAFAAGTLVLLGGAAAVGFRLLTRPLAEVGAGMDPLFGVPFHEVLAATLLGLTLFGGGAFFEAMRVSHLFPRLALLDDPVRRSIATAAGLLLAALATAAGGLAWTRDYLLSSDAGVQALLAQGNATFPGPVFHWFPALAHAVLAVGLVALLTTTVVPLESLLRNGQLVVLRVTTGFVRSLAFVLTLLAALVINGAQVLLRLYDVVVFLPLAVERAVNHALADRTPNAQPDRDGATVKPGPETAAAQAEEPAERSEAS